MQLLENRKDDVAADLGVSLKVNHTACNTIHSINRRNSQLLFK
jgi:hypothetical protein